MAYSYNNYYKDFEDTDFKSKLEYYNSLEGVTVDQRIGKEFDSTVSKAAYAADKKHSYDKSIKKAKEDDTKHNMTQDLLKLYGDIRKAKKERQNIFPWDFKKKKELAEKISNLKKQFKQKNKQRHSIEKNTKDDQEKSDQYKQEIQEHKDHMKRIKENAEKQINLLNQIQATSEVVKTLEDKEPFKSDPNAQNALQEFKDILKEAKVISYVPQEDKNKNLTSKLNELLKYVEIAKQQDIKTKVAEKEKACNDYINRKNELYNSKSKNKNQNTQENDSQNRDDGSR